MSRINTNLLRSTPDAEAWLDQFDSQDRGTAAFALESLILVSHSTFQYGLIELLRETRNKVRDNRPVGLFAVRETEEMKEVLHAEKNAFVRPYESDDCEGVVTPANPRDAVELPYFHPTDDIQRPNATARGAGIGSEGPIGNLIRDLVQEEGNSRFLDHPSIHSMRAVKCREAFLIDDIIGSGRRAYNFVSDFFCRATLKSWHSRHHLRISVVAYAGTESGIQKVRSHRFVDEVFAARPLSAGRATWTEGDRSDVEALCQKYVRRTKHWKIPHGFEAAFTFLIFEHKCPNTVPPIFWSASKRNGWKPLFRKRPGIAFPVWPIPEDEDESRKRFLAQIGQQKLAEIDWQRHIQPLGRIRLTLLAVVAKRLRRPRILSDILGLSLEHVMQLLNECVSIGWLTWDHRITVAGLNELTAARKLGLAPGDEVELRDKFYFPTTLREARDSV